MLVVKDLTCGYGRKTIVYEASFFVEKGEFICVIGANGCGKTTLLKNVLRLYKPFSGSVLMNGRDTQTMDEKERARIFAYIPQAHTPPFPFSTADVVLMGRTPYMGRITQVREDDRRTAWRALCTLGIEQLAHRTYTKLSGGQQQLVLIARAIAQEPELIIMDEPTASLDFGNQQIVLARMKELAARGVSILMVTHDPQHAFLCADRVLVMDEGRIVRQGTSQEVMTKECLEAIYCTPLDVIKVAQSDGKQATVCIPCQ